MTAKQEKRCKDCKRVKPITEFYRNHTCRDGRRSRCKPCYAKVYGKNAKKKPAYRRPNSATYRKDLNATCEFEPGPPDRAKPYEGRTIRGFKETLKLGYLPPGSIWEVQEKRYVVWGIGRSQYITELKRR